MLLPVLPALFKELADERRSAGKTQQEIADLCGVKLRTVERWETLKSLPVRASSNDPGGDLARAVAGYAKGTDGDPFKLWTAALERATDERAKYEATLKASKSGPSRRSKRAATPKRPRPKS